MVLLETTNPPRGGFVLEQRYPPSCTTGPDRRKPGFNESFYGYGSFNELLEDAARNGMLMLERDEKSGGYRVRLAPAE